MVWLFFIMKLVSIRVALLYTGENKFVKICPLFSPNLKKLLPVF